MFKTMLKLKIEVDMEGVVIRYKDFVIVAEFLCGPGSGYFTARIWAPVETEDETDLPFHDLRLENITPWEPGCPGARWDTEGEALLAAMQEVEVFC